MRANFGRADGTGSESMSEHTRSLKTKNHGASIARSICPHCRVGCGQLVFHKDGKLLSIEGDPESPISRGCLCPKGSASFELVTHANRAQRVLYRRAKSRQWEGLPLEQAMDMVADRLGLRRAQLHGRKNGHVVNSLPPAAQLPPKRKTQTAGF